MPAKTMPIANFTGPGLLRTASCTKTRSVCIAVGYSHGIQDEPLLVTSINSGKNWMVEPAPFAEDKIFICDENLHHCAAVKAQAGAAYTPYAGYYSYDGGTTWNEGSVADIPYGTPYAYFMNAMACGTTVNNCVAVGTEGNNVWSPTALVTKDGGANWTAIDPWWGPSECYPSVSVRSGLSSVTCDSSGLICQAHGTCLSNEASIGFDEATNDGGFTWFPV